MRLARGETRRRSLPLPGMGGTAWAASRVAPCPMDSSGSLSSAVLGDSMVAVCDCGLRIADCGLADCAALAVAWGFAAAGAPDAYCFFTSSGDSFPVARTAMG